MDTVRIQKVAWDVMAFWGFFLLIEWIFNYKMPEFVHDALDITFGVWIISLVYNKFFLKK